MQTSTDRRVSIVTENPSFSRASLYGPELHNTVDLDDGHGIVKVDPAIHPLLVDMRRLPFVKETLSSCSGGSSDGMGGQRPLVRYDESHLTWNGYIAFRIDKNCQEGKGFVGRLNGLEAQAPDDRETTASVRIESPAPGVHHLSILYNRQVENERLALLTDLVWQAVHEVVREHLSR